MLIHALDPTDRVELDAYRRGIIEDMFGAGPYGTVAPVQWPPQDEQEEEEEEEEGYPSLSPSHSAATKVLGSIGSVKSLGSGDRIGGRNEDEDEDEDQVGGEGSKPRGEAVVEGARTGSAGAYDSGVL